MECLDQIENSFDREGYARVLAHSAFSRRCLPMVLARGQLLSVGQPMDRSVLLDHLARGWPDLAACYAGGGYEDSEEAVATALRQFRNSALLAIMARDLIGEASLAENLEAITALAELCLQTAYRALGHQMAQRHGVPRRPNGRPVDLLVVGMGKLGGGELNASSDIDLIYVIADEGQTDGVDGKGVLDLPTFFTRLGRKLSVVLGDVTADGIVFRVDLRLRPNGDSGPLISTFAMLEDYLMVQGREWERYAWIKARVVSPAFFSSPELFAQDLQSLEDIRRPFVFRRYLDFNALAALRDLHQQIRDEAQRRTLKRESRLAGEFDPVDLKLGPGGIREVEFIAQLFQLVRGGRNASLQARGTREILQVLGQQGRLVSSEVEALEQAYQFWRRLEHRLQYVEDAQTHVLGGAQADVDHAARSMGLADGTALHAEIARHRDQVTTLFERLFRKEVADANASAEATGAAPRATDRESRLARIARQIDQLALASEAPDSLRAGLQGLIDAIQRRTAYLALFDEYPDALSRVARVIGASSWAGDYLRRHPIVLDELLDARTLFDPPQFDAFAQALTQQLDQTVVQGGQPDVERQMDVLREAHHAQLFRLLVQDLDGLWPLETLSDQLSALADVMIAATLRSAWNASPRRHCDPPRFAVVAYGKLGGKELGYASDLDLIFLHNDAHDQAQENYARLAQRMNVWLTTTTAAGSLFEIDLRLRPNGNAGLLVSDFDGFMAYQMEKAWVWEHQALTRARFCAGDAEIGRAFEQGRIAILRIRRDPTALLEEILAMRQKMHEGHPNTSGLFDLKHDTGGMVDIEFMVQALVLRYSVDHPALTANLGNIALLRIGAELGLITTDLAQSVADAYREFRRQQHRLRLAGAGSARLEPQALGAQRQAVESLWAQVFADAPAVVRSLTEIHDRPQSI
jgi:[glutamine synthetase] adenylyltransferase / [glutamine synthetase]-adenylyl-L-tyrosine phosphorylase